MTCYHPYQGYYSAKQNESGKRSVVFKPEGALIDRMVTVPCGKCLGCRIDKSRDWALRCVHEADLHVENCFITLTYSDENLPDDQNLNKRDYQLFLKRLRKRVYPKIIRYYGCGEYGSKGGRPHFHFCIFGWSPTDKELWKVREGVCLYRSAIVESEWGKGYSTVGEVTFKSAAYIARYCQKVIYGNEAYEAYSNKRKEFNMMSRDPGIGSDWFELYYRDCYPKDFITHEGNKMRVPRYYDKKYFDIRKKEMQKVKVERIKKAEKKVKSPRELMDSEHVKKKQISFLRREIEE